MTWNFENTTACLAAMVEPLSGLQADEQLIWRIGVLYIALLVAGVLVNVVLFFRFQAAPLNWEHREEALKNIPWQTNYGAAALIFVAGLYFAVSLAKRAFAGGTEDPSHWVLLQSAFFHLTGIGIIAYALKRQGLEWRRAFGMEKKRWRADLGRGILLYLAMMPVLFFYTFLYQWALRSLGYRALPQDVIVLFVSEDSGWNRAYTFVLAALIAPVFEELVFRGVALPILARQRGAMWAVIVLSGVFALIHFHVPSVVPLFIVAVALSLGYIYSGSLTVPIVAHGLFNLINLLALSGLRSVL